MADVEALLTERLAPAFEAVAGEGLPADPGVRRSEHADFQADGALALARRLGRPPREIAAEVVERAALDDVVASVEISGPGFVNLVVRDDVLGRLVAGMAADERLGVPRAASPEIVVVDYSAPNAAKEMHVGHLRSTIIGDAAVRVLEWLGHTVVRQNHMGDWGTPFGMLIEHLVDVGETEAAYELSVGDLDGFYKAARKKFDGDELFRDRSRARVVLLQGGDEASRRLWGVLVAESLRYFQTVYDRLHVRLGPEDVAGESFYNDRLRAVVEDLDRVGLLQDSEGARCVFPAGFVNRAGDPLPLIVQKTDEGFGYAATDLAALRYRVDDLGATRLLYVVGLPQRQHLAMIFETAREAGWLAPPVRAEHVGFGSVLGPDGKVLRSRTGASVRLIDLLDEAVVRAGELIAAKSPDLDDATRAALADAVAVGAVKYSDLSTQRTKDYVFDWDRMLAFDGNTAPYLQYAHTRIRSILRRADVVGGLPPVAAIQVVEPAERALALQLLAFEPTVAKVAETLEFHRLAEYLYRLATAFTAFYEHCPVLRAEGDTRRSRLALSEVTGRVLAQGLDLLGIEAPDRM
jgi:arginyl-tRNA synthetase